MSGLSVEAIAAFAPVDPAVTAAVRQPVAAAAAGQTFEQMMLGGIEATDSKVQAADEAAAAFAVDDSIPLHQVMFALEDARLSFELMLQVRSRLVEGYQEIMRMQL